MSACTVREVPLSFEIAPWVTQVKARCGLHFGPTRVRRLNHALQQRMDANGVTPDAYWNLLVEDLSENEWQALIDELVINETKFYRHQPSFDLLETVLFPRLFEIAKACQRPTLNILSAGCANGSEAYSLIIGALPHSQKSGIPIQVTGLDISEKAVAIAKSGCFPKRALRGLIPQVRQQYFKEEGAGGILELIPELKQMAIFRRANLLAPTSDPGGPYDLIFCQNLLIYLENQDRQKLLSIFANHLNPCGYLILGPAEVLRWRDKRLEKKQWQQTLVFQKIQLETQ